jgi:hypothetical protein
MTRSEMPDRPRDVPDNNLSSIGQRDLTVSALAKSEQFDLHKNDGRT